MAQGKGRNMPRFGISFSVTEALEYLRCKRLFSGLTILKLCVPLCL